MSDEVNSHSAMLQGEAIFTQEKYHQAVVYSSPPKSRVQHKEIYAFSMKKCFWRWDQAETEYKLLQTFRGGKVGGRQQNVNLLPTSTIKMSEAMPIDTNVRF